MSASIRSLAIAAAALVPSAVTPAMAQTETTIESPGPAGALSGTLLDAGRGAPIVVMIPGSGPTDRDGNSAMAGVRPASLKLLAQGLAAHGISSVRVDKRGMFGSRAATANPNDVTISGYADDLHGWVKTIRAKTGARCVWLLGHSEGGLVALKAAQAPEGICGLILVDAAGRRFGPILREQLRANPANAPLLGEALPAIDLLEAGKPVDTSTMNPALLSLFRPEVQAFVIDEMAQDPAKLAAAYTGPVLVVQGMRDIQVSGVDADALHVAHAGSQLLLVPGMTHVLKFVGTDDRAANIATYADPSLPLAPGLVDGIAAFVKAH